MTSLTRLAWFLPLVAACGSTSVHTDLDLDGGDRSTGGAGGNAGYEDAGVAAGGRGFSRPGTGATPATGGFFNTDGGYPGSGGFTPFPGTGGSFFGDGGFFGAGGEFFGAGGGFAAGGFFGAGGDYFGGGGSFAGSAGAFAAGGRLVDPACCEAIPFCRAGYDQVSGPGECVRGDICYEATACCSTIWCKAHADQDAGACAAEAPPGVHYISANASVCDRRAWKCPTNTYQYWDTCGCGCTQDAGCPASVDCTVVPKNTLCTDNATCPYTDRTF